MFVNDGKKRIAKTFFDNTWLGVTVEIYKANANHLALELTSMSDLTFCNFPGHNAVNLILAGGTSPAIDSHDQGYITSALVSFIASSAIVTPETILGIAIYVAPTFAEGNILFFIQPLSPTITVATPGDGLSFQVDLDAQDFNVILPH